MLNIGTGEIIFIAVAALLILGPKKLPEFARTIGKLVRDFRRQTDDVRNTVEREFYKMDHELTSVPDPVLQPAPESVAQSFHEGGTPDALPPGAPDASQVMKGAPSSEPVAMVDAPMSADALSPAPTEPAPHPAPEPDASAAPKASS